MNSQVQPPLKELLINDLPPGFVRALYERMERIYPEAYTSMYNDPMLGKDQAGYSLGYYRRGVAETVLDETAQEYGLRVETVQPEGGGCKHVRVSSEKFSFTMCHVHSRAGFPQHSESREQSSQINEHLQQRSLLPSEPKEEVDSDVMFGVIVHTESMGRKDVFGDMHIGFPNVEFSDWLEEPIDFRDLIDLQQQLFQEQKDLQAQIQQPVPVFKKGVRDKKRRNES